MAVAAYTQAEKEAIKAPDWEIFYSKGGCWVPLVLVEWLSLYYLRRLVTFCFSLGRLSYLKAFVAYVIST